jgi:hypothetical protein
MRFAVAWGPCKFDSLPSGEGTHRMRLIDRVVATAPVVVALVGCAKGQTATDVDAPGAPADASCGELCDTDGDGVVDGSDDCPDTPTGEVVNDAGCSDSQVSPTLEPNFPPFGLAWTPTGDLGRAGGLTWTYTGIDRADLFHIYWLVCDDPATPCGLSLDGPIDMPAEGWQFSAAQSNLAGGQLVFSNTASVVLADTTVVPLTGRLTVTLVDGAAPIPFDSVGNLGVTARLATHGAEIPGTGYVATVLAEVQDSTAVWTPYLDYYDAAPTADPGPGTAVSFGASFYSE